MAARRITASAVDWAEFAKKIPDTQKVAFNALKNRHDSYVRKIAALPEKAPKLDWAAYKSKIPIAGLVDDFQKRYEALQVPFPKDTLSASIEQQGVQQKADYEAFVKNSKARIVDINADLAKWEAMMPVEEMNMEEALEYVPHLVKANPNKPSLWPHEETVEEYKERLKKMDDKDDHH